MPRTTRPGPPRWRRICRTPAARSCRSSSRPWPTRTSTSMIARAGAGRLGVHRDDRAACARAIGGSAGGGDSRACAVDPGRIDRVAGRAAVARALEQSRRAVACGSIYMIGPLRARAASTRGATAYSRLVFSNVILVRVRLFVLTCALAALLAAARRRRAGPARLEQQAVHVRADRRRSRPPDARGRDRRRGRHRRTPARSSSPTICR